MEKEGKRGGTWINGSAALNRGMHYLRVWEPRSLEMHLVELKPPKSVGNTLVTKDPYIYDVQMINPTKYRAFVKAGSVPSPLVLQQNFHVGWRASVRNPDGTIIPLHTHFEVNGHCNGWRVPKLDRQAEIIMEYAPQKFMQIGSWVTIISLIACGIILALPRRNRDSNT
jgi:hypothetical protein